MKFLHSLQLKIIDFILEKEQLKEARLSLREKRDLLESDMYPYTLLSFNLEQELPVIRVVVPGKKQSYHTDNALFDKRMQELITIIERTFPLYKLYLIDEEFQIIGIRVQQKHKTAVVQTEKDLFS